MPLPNSRPLVGTMLALTYNTRSQQSTTNVNLVVLENTRKHILSKETPL